MRIRVLFFAQVRRAAGVESLALDMNDGANVGDVVGEIVRRFPAVEALRGSLLLTRNQSWCKGGENLSEGDEVGLMPPVSGG